MKLPKNLSIDRVMDAAKECMSGSGEYIGYCLTCGEEVSPVEPDIEREVCPFCGKRTVYGAEEIIFYWG